MHRTLRRELRILRAYAFVTSLLLAGLSAAAIRQGSTSPTFGRIEFLDGQGTVVARVPAKDDPRQ